MKAEGSSPGALKPLSLTIAWRGWACQTASFQSACHYRASGECARLPTCGGASEHKQGGR